MWSFRRAQTPQDGPDRHALTMDLIERVADLQGQFGALKAEWNGTKDTLQKGWQRLEKANQRAERRLEDGDNDEKVPAAPEHGDELRGFAKKLADRNAQLL